MPELNWTVRRPSTSIPGAAFLVVEDDQFVWVIMECQHTGDGSYTKALACWPKNTVEGVESARSNAHHCVISLSSAVAYEWYKPGRPLVSGVWSNLVRKCWEKLRLNF